ncbi:MAG: hypothetical protein ABIL47_04780 [candidate division WOR-3 bacterium]
MTNREWIIFVSGILVGVLLITKCNLSKKEKEIIEIKKVDTLKVIDTIEIVKIETLFLGIGQSLKAYKCDSVLFNFNVDFSKLEKLKVDRKNEFWFSSYFEEKIKDKNYFSLSPGLFYDFENKKIAPIISFQFKKFQFYYVYPKSFGLGFSISF